MKRRFVRKNEISFFALVEVGVQRRNHRVVVLSAGIPHQCQPLESSFLQPPKSSTEYIFDEFASRVQSRNRNKEPLRVKENGRLCLLTSSSRALCFLLFSVVVTDLSTNYIPLILPSRTSDTSHSRSRRFQIDM